MKPLLIVLFLLLTHFTAHTQARIGYTFSEIYNDFKVEGEFTPEFTEEGHFMTSIELYGQFYVTYIFKNNNHTCTSTSIIPLTAAAEKLLIDKYNTECIKINNNRWKVKFDNGVICNILMTKLSTNETVFMWTEAK